MIIRRYKNCKNRKEAIIIQGENIYIVECYHFGEFKHINDHKSFKKAQKEAFEYIENDK